MNKESTKALALFTQIAISMIVPIFLCFFVGKAIDSFLKLNGIFLIIFTILGILAGFRSVYVLVREFYKGKDTYVDMNKIKEDLKKQGQAEIELRNKEIKDIKDKEIENDK